MATLEGASQAIYQILSTYTSKTDPISNWLG